MLQNQVITFLLPHFPSTIAFAEAPSRPRQLFAKPNIKDNGRDAAILGSADTELYTPASTVRSVGGLPMPENLWQNNNCQPGKAVLRSVCKLLRGWTIAPRSQRDAIPPHHHHRSEPRRSPPHRGEKERPRPVTILAMLSHDVHLSRQFPG